MIDTDLTIVCMLMILGAVVFGVYAVDFNK